jgi:S1-C subfamily serine protease/HEAT repeat protein
MWPATSISTTFVLVIRLRRFRLMADTWFGARARRSRDVGRLAEFHRLDIGDIFGFCALLALGGSIASCGGSAEPPAAPPSAGQTAAPGKVVVASTNAAEPTDRAGSPPSKPGERTAATSAPLTTAQIVARVEPSVAVIRGKRSSGTGFLVRPGVLVTNAHVIEGEVTRNLEIAFPSAPEGQRGPAGAELISKDTKRDLAFLKVNTSLPPLEIAEAYRYQKGDDVLVIGNPGIGGKVVLENAVSRGVMSTRTEIEGQPFYQLGIALNPGNSGGPVVDLAGKVIGVASRKASNLEGTAFSIPVEDLRLAVGKISSQGETTLASSSAPARGGVDLHYGWKPGQTYVYGVHVSIERGKTVVTMDGSSIYKPKASDPEGTTLSHQGWLITRKRNTDQAGSGGEIRMPAGPATTEFNIDGRGDVQNAQGSLPVPLLGDLSQLVIEPLPDEKLAQWDDVRTVALLEVQSSGGGGGVASPFRFGRPSVIDRMRQSRAVGRIGPRAGVRPAPGIRPGARAGMRGGRRGVPAPAPQEVKVISHPAHERSEYALESSSGTIASIAKTYELKSEESTGGEPRLLMTGKGTLTFDVKQGIPVAFRFEAKVTENSENVTLRVPIEVSCRLLEGAERERALRFPVIPPTAMNPLKESDVAAAVAELGSRDLRRRVQAAVRLRDCAPIEGRGDEVIRALLAQLDDRDGSIRNAAIQALGVWGRADTVQPLIDRLNDDRYGSHSELFEALARLEPDPRTARAMLDWLAKDTGQAVRVLRSMGPAAEPELLKFVAGKAQPQLRVEACRVLKDIGTSQSEPVLQGLARQKDSEELGRVAEGAARVIRARYLKDAELTLMLEQLGSPDANRRREAARRLEQARPVEARRAEVAGALAKRLLEPDNDAQRTIVRALAPWGDLAAAAALAEKLKDPSFLPWREAIPTLGKIGHDSAAAEALAGWVKQDRRLAFLALASIGPAAEPTLIKLVRYPGDDWGVRSEACKALETVGTKACIPTLQEAAMNRKEAFVAMAAEAALKKLQASDGMSEAAASLMLDRLKSPDANQRRQAISSLADARPDPRRRAAVAEALAAALADPDENIQRDALRAFRVWADRSDAAVLVDRAKDRNFRPWREALEILTQVDPGQRAAEAVIDRMPDDFGHAHRLLRELGPVAEPAALETFQKGTDLRLRVELGRALETIGTDASLPILQQAADRTGEGTVANAADDALRGIAARG